MRITEWTFNADLIPWRYNIIYVGGVDITIIAHAERDEYPNEWMCEIKLSAQTERITRAVSSGIKACITALEVAPDQQHPPE